MEQNIARTLSFLSRKSQAYIGCALSKYNLTAAEQPFFMALQRYEGVTQEELTALVCVDKAATARAVRSLEEKGFLIRVQDKQDRRQNRIYPTDAARRLGPAVKGELLRFNALLTQGIDPAGLDAARAALRQMEENISRASAGGRAASRQEGQSHDTEE